MCCASLGMVKTTQNFPAEGTKRLVYFYDNFWEWLVEDIWRDVNFLALLPCSRSWKEAFWNSKKSTQSQRHCMTMEVWLDYNGRVKPENMGGILTAPVPLEKFRFPLPLIYGHEEVSR